uniref:Carboxylic ester hydrolase (EC) n=1 Tax=Ganoderma boninense TaxID=34458 RepID=A0A5K1JXB1_9APHY|nr:Carboxylic ester hydrolase (EC [Ganoderma boninense]
MESGSPLPTGYVDNPLCQATFNDFVSNAGCSGSEDSIACLRNVSTDVFVRAVNKAPSLSDYKQVDLPWLPRADGDFVAFPPEQQLRAGKTATVPFVVGNVLDEGTRFSFPTMNVTTDEEFIGYVAGSWFPDAPRSSIKKLLKLYPPNPSAGSPFGTGDNFAYTPQFKRMAALQGDLLFVAPRRLLTQRLAEKQVVYAFVSNEHRVDGMGAPHSTDLQDVFGAPGGHLQDYLIRFAATLNPNGDGAFEWPRYTALAPRLLRLNDAEPKLETTRDDFRKEAMEYLTQLSLAHPL